MSDKSNTVRLNRRQIDFLIHFTGELDVTTAMRMFARAMSEEGISPSKMPDYINKLIEKKGSR